MVKEHLRGAGFTLVEILVSLFIIAMLSAVVAAVFGNLGRDADIICTVNEMKTIKDATTDYFYPDLGIVPRDFGEDPGNLKDDKPWRATRYLCLTKDPKIEEKFSEITYDLLDPESREMCDFLEYQRLPGNDKSVYNPKGHFNNYKVQLKWDKLFRKGWNGPYVEADAAYKNKEGNYLPVVANPWATKFKDNLKKAYEENNQEEIDKWEALSFYWILWRNEKKARIICFGANGKDDGSFCEEYNEDGSCKKFTTAEKLNDLDYDIGDDIVMFIFSGRTRSPLK
jgi:prepilin-type N-terminal cleavage/methylation domain-containing protein